MCIFSRPVVSVNNTQIFARPSGAGTQFLAYQMNYESSEQNAMILPLPVKQPSDENSLKFIDLKNYEGLFDDLDLGFPYSQPPSGISCSESKDSMEPIELRVFEVGNYIASFVPSIAEFDRLDPRFVLPNEVWAKIPEYKNFGFAVFQLAAGSLKPHPMALEFRTETDELFFPTIHIHDGEVHQREEFDHVLYLQHAGLDGRVHGYENSDVEDKSTGLIRSKHKASQFCSADRSKGLVLGDLLVHRKIIRGNLPNLDTTFAIKGDPLKPAFNFRPWLSYAPWLVVLTAIGWFFNRRSRLSKRLNRAGEDNAT